MDGSDKCVPLVIGHYAKPRCFKHVQSLPVDYQHSKNAWMTSQIFLDWLRRLNARMVEENRNIVLFLDNCSSHAKATSSANLSNITIHYLPPNSTSRTQPMDQGVIRSLKCVYRRKLLEQIVSAFDAGKYVKELLKINLKDAILLLSASWKSVTVRTISNCFRHAAFSQPDGNATANVSDVERDQSSITTPLWQQAAGALGVDAADGDLSSFVAVDDDVFTEPVLSAENLLRERHAADEADSEESDEEEVCPRAPKPTRSQAVAGLQMVMDYLQSLPDTSSAIFSHAAAIDEFLVNRALTACTQQSIDDFFRPLPDHPKPAKNTDTSCLQQSRKRKVVQVSLHSALESKFTQKSSPCLPADKETQPAACDVLCSEDDLPTVFAPPARRRCAVILSSSSEDDRSEPQRLTSKQQEQQPHQSPKQVPTKGPLVLCHWVQLSCCCFILVLGHWVQLSCCCFFWCCVTGVVVVRCELLVFWFYFLIAHWWCCWFCPVRRLLQQFIVLPVLVCLHAAVVHVSRLVLLVYYSVECHQGSMCCRMTIVVRVMTFPKLSCAWVYVSETSMRGWWSEVFLFCRLRSGRCFIMSVVL